MSKSELFKQAIAEAKELKDISMAQAKQQIAEAFAPRISEMFKAKVEAMDEADEMEEGFDKMEEMSSKEKMAKGLYNEDEMEEVNETSLDEILAELDADNAALEEGEEELEEGYEAGNQTPEIEEAAKKADDKKEDKKDDKEEAPKEDEAPADDAEDMDDLGADDLGDDLDLGTDADAEGQEIVDLSVEDFKNLVRDVVADVLANHGEPDADNLDGDAAGLDMGADMEMPADDMGSDLGADGDMGAEDDSISLDEILAELEEEGLEEADKMEEGEEKIEENDELEEAVATIEELKATINEMNLFNAKLLYTNKIFEAKSLNNTQKAKVLNAFDKAANLNEVKAIYKTLTTTLDSTKKTQLKESLGFASKAVGSAPAKPILEENAYVTRFQQLAGIKKTN